MNIPILYEDNHILVVTKPMNMPTQPDDSGSLDLLTALKDDLKNRYDKPGNVYLGLVHRLDRPVGGAMVFAKTSKAASRLSNAVRTRAFRKIYIAVVHGVPKETQAKIRHFLLKDVKTNTVSVVPENKPGAKEAILDYETLGSSEGFSLLKVNLHTGRPHQIRVQLSTIGTPIFGDQRYGAHVNQIGQQIALWSVTLTFEHPTRKETMTFTSIPPEQYPWQLWMNLIRNFAE